MIKIFLKIVWIGNIIFLF